MRRIALLLLLFLLLPTLCLPAQGLAIDEAQAIQEEDLDLDGLERAAQEQGGRRNMARVWTMDWLD